MQLDMKVGVHDIVAYRGIITRTSKSVTTLWRSCELFLHRDISRVRRTRDITRTSEWCILVWRSCKLFLCRDIS